VDASLSLCCSTAADVTKGSNRVVNNMVNNIVKWSLDVKPVLGLQVVFLLEKDIHCRNAL
jgi:hypothetical protein